MKKIFFLIPFVLTSFISLPAQAQVGVCVQTRRVYRPEGYDAYGNYYPPAVFTQQYNVPCPYQPTYTQNNYFYSNQNNNQNNTQLSCDPTRAILGGLLGGGIAAGLSRGDGYAWSVPLGAALGGAVAGCVN